MSSSSSENVDNLLSKVKSEFPELKMSQRDLIDHGWDHDVIDIDDKFIFRFTTNDKFRGRLANEVKILQVISSFCDTSIPDYKYVANDFSFGGYGKIKGELLTAQVFESLNKRHKDLLAQQVADFLSTIHSVDVYKLSTFGIKNADIKEEYIQLLNGVDVHFHAVFTSDEILEIKAILNRYKEINIPNTTFIHRDFYGKNLLWDSQNLNFGVIDFTDCVFGDPAADFTELYEYSSEFVDAVYNYYQGPKDDNFLERSRLYYKKVGIYLMVQSFLGDNITFKEAKEIFDIAMDI